MKPTKIEKLRAYKKAMELLDEMESMLDSARQAHLSMAHKKAA